LELTFIFVFLAVGAGCWFTGLWSNVITLVCVVFAGMIATSFYEPLADLLEGSLGRMTYLLDLISVWLLFFVAFGFLRLVTEVLSPYRVKFNHMVDLVGRSLLSVWIAWVFVCFSMFTLHLSPIEPAGFGGGFQSTPNQNNFLGIGPDRMWLAFVQSRSMGAFAEYKDFGILPEYKEALHPDDRGSNSRIFDSKSEFILKYYDRRLEFSKLNAYLVN
ncbi:MAG: CvpA family protein, partial [Planctomycetota bacterium]|nr:CvpA family protein [Planctomycetota bacterium]